jgi:hypothetical protein
MICLVLPSVGLWALYAQQVAPPGQPQAARLADGWRLVSSKTGEIPAPNSGGQQTSATVFDIDGDGMNDFVITERTQAPAVVGYLRRANGWTRIVIEAEKLRPEAGSTFGDVDGDGDLDFIAGADSSGNEVWWWENPGKALQSGAPWQRRTLKSSGGKKHHDQLWVDVDGDGRGELVFWNQGEQALMVAHPPSNPREEGEWKRTVIYRYSEDSEMLQRGSAPAWKKPNEHEGLWFADINGDGRKDLIGGGYWFQHKAGWHFLAHPVDASYHFSRSAAGDLVEGGRPEILLVVGDGVGPLVMYEWVKGTWRPSHLLEDVVDGHSVNVVDFNGDGHLDIFCAEMNLGKNPRAKAWMLLGDGRGKFQTTVLSEGFDHHESRMEDLDGDGDLDVLAKPYNFETPAIHVFLNQRKQ